MSNPTQNPEQTPKKPALGKILYLAVVGLLAVVLLAVALVVLLVRKVFFRRGKKRCRYPTYRG